MHVYLFIYLFITHAGIAAGVGTAFSRVCLFVCLSVCPRSKRKTVWSVNTKLGTRIFYSSRSARLIQKSKNQRSRSHCYENRTVARLLVIIAALLCILCAAYSCATCGLCRRGSACRYDCLCFILYRENGTMYLNFGKRCVALTDVTLLARCVLPHGELRCICECYRRRRRTTTNASGRY